MHNPERFSYICHKIHPNFIPNGVSMNGATTIAGWFIMENPNLKWMDDLRVPPFIETFILFQIYIIIYNIYNYIIYI